MGEVTIMIVLLGISPKYLDHSQQRQNIVNVETNKSKQLDFNSKSILPNSTKR